MSPDAESDGPCADAVNACKFVPGSVTVTVTMTEQPDGSWAVTGANCNAPVAKARPTAPGQADVRDEITKLVPHTGIGIAPPGGVTLVNIQTLFWVDTAANRNLGTVLLLGHKVELQVTVTKVVWDFGDGSSDRTTSPGRPYVPADPCTTPLCPQYFGHVYRTTGAITVTARTTWSGRYRVDNGTWQTIATPVSGPPDTLAITVKQARGVLVPTPDH